MSHFFQCAKRWAEIQQTSTSQHSSSDSRHLSKLLNSVLHFADEKELTNETVLKDIVRSGPQSASVKTNSSLGQQLQTNLEAGIYRVYSVLWVHFVHNLDFKGFCFTLLTLICLVNLTLNVLTLISIYILHTPLYAFALSLTRRISLTL